MSDSIIHGDELADEVARLDRDELLLTGRVLRIAWVDGSEAERIRSRFFAESRW